MKVFKALVCVINPGIICPPIHLKFASTTLIVMQVPKSMVTIGGGTNLAAEIKPNFLSVHIPLTEEKSIFVDLSINSSTLI